jgi:archaemetzincin
MKGVTKRINPYTEK